MTQDKTESVTQQEVAERAGVSRSVVSYVLNNGPRKVSDETRQRVLTAIQELGYHPNKHAQRLKWGSEAARNSIGIVYHIRNSEPVGLTGEYHPIIKSIQQ